MIPAPLDRCLDDPRLSPFARNIYGLLHRHLVYHEYREVKLGLLANRFRTPKGRANKGSISRVLGHLVHLGYLARGPDGGSPGRVVRTYLLTHPPSEGFRGETLPAA